MATFFNNSTVVESNSTDAQFRAWVGFIDAALTGGGWVNTADTGQMTIASASHPVAITTDVGFRMYRMADTLQATKPVFMKVAYGSGAAANTPRVNITIGTGTDGAGTVTGILTSGILPTSAVNSTSACASYASASTSRFHMLMFVRAGANDLMVFSIERTKDATGADTGTGLLVSYGNSGPLVFTLYLSTTAGAQPPVELGCATTLANASGSSAFGGNVGIGTALHFNGVVQQPGIGVIAVNSADFPAQSAVTFTVYGATHTFQLGDSAVAQWAIPTGNNTFANRPTTRIGIRYE